MIKVAHVLYNERPNSGLLRSQVISPLEEIKKLKPELDITVIAIWQPWVYFLQKKKINQMAEKLAQSDIKLENKPFALLPSRYFLYDYRTLPFLMLFATGIFLLLGLGRFNIVHNRSYLASYISAKLKKRYGYNSIFDVRSLFPEEHVGVGVWELYSKTYNKWKEYELFTIANSDSTTVVTEGMKMAIDEIVPDKQSDLVPNSADTDMLYFDAQAREEFREKNGLENKFVIAYLGSLAARGAWNSLENYSEYFKRMKNVSKDIHFVFLIPQIFPEFHQIMAEASISEDNYTIVESSNELAKWLSAADAGIHIMAAGAEGQTRMGVKVGEYLSCGLPVITNSNVGAATFNKKNHTGIKLDQDERFETVFAGFLKDRPTREHCREVAMGHFSKKIVGRRYLDIYERFIAQDKL